MKVLVCGGRTYEDEGFVNYTLDTIHFIAGIDVIIHGDAGKFYDMPDSYIGDEVGFWVGADKLAGQWARRHNITENFYKANWVAHGRKAGPIRNQYMLEKEKPDLVVAFPGGRGTKDMVKRAREGGYKVYEVGEN
jgi:hypothetical protein